MIALREILFMAGYLFLRVGLPLLVLMIIGTYVQKANEGDAQRNKRNMA